jgi:hypothetical protein
LAPFAVAGSGPLTGQDHHWGRLHWHVGGKKVRTIQVRDHTLMDSPFRTILPEMVVAWNDALPPKSLRLDYVAAGAAGCRQVRFVADVINVCQDQTMYWVGATTVDENPRTHHILSAKVKLRSLTDATEDRITSCHELGHTLGLDHSTSHQSCVADEYGDYPGTTPGPHDVEQLALIYGKKGHKPR